MAEAASQAAIRLRAPALGVHLERNNVGACQDEAGRLIRYGLANDSAQLQKRFKSSDLVGLKRGGRAIYVECKAPGWTNPFPDDTFWRGPRPARGRVATEREVAQYAYICHKRQWGAVAGFCACVEDFERLILDAGI